MLWVCCQWARGDSSESDQGVQMCSAAAPRLQRSDLCCQAEVPAFNLLGDFFPPFCVKHGKGIFPSGWKWGTHMSIFPTSEPPEEQSLVSRPHWMWDPSACRDDPARRTARRLLTGGSLRTRMLPREGVFSSWLVLWAQELDVGGGSRGSTSLGCLGSCPQPLIHSAPLACMVCYHPAGRCTWFSLNWAVLKIASYAQLGEEGNGFQIVLMCKLL